MDAHKMPFSLPSTVSIKHGSRRSVPCTTATLKGAEWAGAAGLAAVASVVLVSSLSGCLGIVPWSPTIYYILALGHPTGLPETSILKAWDCKLI